jgi:hypothetical protein
MRKFIPLLLLLFLFSPSQAHGACSGGSPTWTAASPSSTDVAACLSQTLHCGDTIIVPAGSATWATQVTVTPPTGCASNQGVTLQGATACTGGCNPGSEGIGLAFADNAGTCSSVGTCITENNGSNHTLFVGQCSNTSFCRVTGFTFIDTASTDSNGNIALEGTHVAAGCGSGCASFRFDHNHILNSANSTVMTYAYNGYGLIDHVLYADSASTTAGEPISVGGDLPTAGYLNWEDATNPGTAEGVIAEDNAISFVVGTTGDGTFDTYYGAKFTFRHNQVTNQNGSGNHGTDSGAQRSTVLIEEYNNAISCGNNGGGFYNSRGGITIIANNVLTNATGGHCGSSFMQYLRYQTYGNATDAPTKCTVWGCANPGLNYIPITLGGNNNTLNAPAWAATTYSAGAAVVSSNGGPCNLQTAAGGTSTGSAPACPGVGGSVTDSGGVVWVNVGGSTGASPFTTGAFLSTAPDTPCNTTGVGTCTLYFDPRLTGCVYRDFPGCAHNQVYYGNWASGNSGAGAPSPIMIADTTDRGITSLCATNIPATGTPCLNIGSLPGGYSFYTYPDPLQGLATAPTFNPGAGTYAGAQTVTISSPLGTVLCWNTTGSPVTAGNGSSCTTGTAITTNSGTNCVASHTVCGDITVSSSETVYAVAGSATLSDSTVASAVYTINTSGITHVILGGTVKIGTQVNQ